MKILHSNTEDIITAYFNYEFDGWFDFLMTFVKMNLPDNESYILKAKQDSCFRCWFPKVPQTNKAEFYIVTILPTGTIKIRPQGDSIRLSGKEYYSINDFVKTRHWSK